MNFLFFPFLKSSCPVPAAGSPDQESPSHPHASCLSCMQAFLGHCRQRPVGTKLAAVTNRPANDNNHFSHSPCLDTASFCQQYRIRGKDWWLEKTCRRAWAQVNNTNETASCLWYPGASRQGNIATLPCPWNAPVSIRLNLTGTSHPAEAPSMGYSYVTSEMS